MFRSGSELVWVDLVVRDSEGRLVTDLRPDEVQVFEEGSACRASEFGLVRNGTRGAAGASLAAAQPTVVMLAFDLLGQDGAQRSREAALRFLEQAFPPDSWFAVFKVGQGRFGLQGFTLDAGLAAKSVEVATGGGEHARASASDGVSANLTEQAVRARDDAQAAARNPRGYTDAMFKQVLANILRNEDQTERERRGRWSIYPLLSIARELRGLSGRKTLLYFSEGLSVTPALEEAFRELKNESNGSNLAVYAFDARGLESRSPFAETRGALGLGTEGSRPTGGGSADLKGDSALEVMRLDVRGSIQDLAESTGGFLVADTNDLRQGMDRVAAELSSYYEIGCVPLSPGTDGRFRRIEVKVSRPGVSVRSRQGYYALPPHESPTLPWEVMLADAMATDPAPQAFEHKAGALRFADGQERSELAVLVDVPLNGIHILRDDTAGVYRAHLQVLALLKDSTGHVVARLSHDWPHEGPLAGAHSAERQTLRLSRSVHLGPGRYSLETAVHDRIANAISVGRTSVEIPVPGGPTLGDVAIVRLQAATGPRGPSDDSFVVGDVRATPILGEAAPENAQMLSFLLSVHPAPVPQPIAVTLEFRREGRVVGRSTPALPPPDTRGRIAYLGSVPSAGFAPGKYELTVEAIQGTAKATQTTHFSIADRTGTSPAEVQRPNAAEKADCERRGHGRPRAGRASRPGGRVCCWLRADIPLHRG